MSLTPISLADEKRSLRVTALEKRHGLVAGGATDAGERLTANVIGLVQRFAGSHRVSGFLPIGDEIDLEPALYQLGQQGLTTCLPVVVKKDQPLIFREWKRGDGLASGPLTTRHPLESAAACTPDIVLVPLLAFDLEGYRLGWGGGFYDRTLAALKSHDKTLVAIGIGFDGQQVDRVPADGHDVAVDWIVTEKRVIEIMKAGN
ncbi:MAG: 5-formyltetrahydrofolate cyclo-ligase [Rhodospirillales bacterium]|nr:5-formyltetrahydrofolate cyclo-ligase [Rhodospirillales bacterium]